MEIKESKRNLFETAIKIVINKRVEEIKFECLKAATNFVLILKNKYTKKETQEL